MKRRKKGMRPESGRGRYEGDEERRRRGLSVPRCNHYLDETIILFQRCRLMSKEISDVGAREEEGELKRGESEKKEESGERKEKGTVTTSTVTISSHLLLPFNIPSPFSFSFFFYSGLLSQGLLGLHPTS